MAKKPKTIDQMNWSSLTGVKGHIERNCKGETIESFQGHTLTTNKAVYTLGPEGLSVHPKETTTIKEKANKKPVGKAKKN